MVSCPRVSQHRPPPTPAHVSVETASATRPSWSAWTPFPTLKETRCAWTRWWNSRLPINTPLRDILDYSKCFLFMFFVCFRVCDSFCLSRLWSIYLFQTVSGNYWTTPRVAQCSLGAFWIITVKAKVNLFLSVGRLSKVKHNVEKPAQGNLECDEAKPSVCVQSRRFLSLQFIQRAKTWLLSSKGHPFGWLMSTHDS